VRHVKPIPSIEIIGEVVNEALKAFPEEVRVIAEPGRYMVSDAGYFVCRVLGTTTRGGKRWMHWDAGLFGGIIETTEGLKYKIRTERSGHDIPWHVAGPTCDSVDVILRDEPLPSDRRKAISSPRNASTYQTCASEFNGFRCPKYRFRVQALVRSAGCSTRRVRLSNTRAVRSRISCHRPCVRRAALRARRRSPQRTSPVVADLRQHSASASGSAAA
jgi:hypothetical protein